MIYAGCDLGISAAKVVITENKTILSYEIIPYRNSPHKAVTEAMEGALLKAGVSEDEIVSCTGTGFGQKVIHFADRIDSNALCLLRAMKSLNPQVQTIIDVGGHFMMASNITPNWKLINLAKLDDCASATGLFLDMIAGMLELPLEELAAGSIDSENSFKLTNTCVVFAESEVISRINEGHNRFEIFAGITHSVAKKVIGMVNKVEILPEVAMAGGVAKCAGVTNELERYFGIKLADLNGVDPQIVTAFGAALLAEENTTSEAKPE